MAASCQHLGQRARPHATVDAWCACGVFRGEANAPLAAGFPQRVRQSTLA